jgi:hypothetical protein
MKNFLFLIGIVSVIILSSCEKDASLKTYTLNLTVDNQTSDTIGATLLYMSDDGVTATPTEIWGDVYYLKGISYHTYSMKSNLKNSRLTWWWKTTPIIKTADTVVYHMRSSDYLFKTQNDSLTLTFLKE